MNNKKQNKKKGGRPRKSLITKKTEKIGVCFSEPEFYTIKHRASHARMNLSHYCHDAILNARIVEPIKKEDMHVLRGLSNMGNNLNQLLKTTRFMGMKRIEAKAIEVLDAILEIIKKLSDDWKSAKRKKF